MRLSNYPRSVALLVAGTLSLTAFAKGGQIDRTVLPADATGEVEISNTSGTIDVRGWDRNEVEVTGHLGEDVERLAVESTPGRTLVKVILPRGHNSDGEAVIEVRVPKGSTVNVGAVSADISSKGVIGTQRLKSVSGEVTAEVSGDDSEVRSVSGDVTVRGTGKPSSLRVSSVSGSLDLLNVAGKLDMVTVSGDARVTAGETSEIRGRTTSGDLTVNAKLARDGRVDVEGVSGDISLRLTTPGAVSTEIESFSGDITGCLADDKVERVSKYGPGVRLNLRAPDAGAPRVRAKTLSGDVDICNR